MSKYSRKIKKGLAVVLSLAMTMTSVTVANSTEASAAAKKYVKSLKVSKSKVSITSGKKATVKATVKVAKKASKKVKVTLAKSAKKVVSVKVGKPNKKGVSKITFTAKEVTAKQTVTAKVTTVAKNKKNKKITKKIKVTVKPASASVTPAPDNGGSEAIVTAVNVSAAQTSIKVGASTKVTAAVTPSDAKTTITWSSSNNAVASVDAQGTVVGVNAGKATITGVASNGVKGSVEITVVTVPVTGISVDHSSLSLTVGATSVLKETIAPADATDKRVVWTSSDSAVVGVVNGKVTAYKEGEATITVETVDGGFKASTKVTVTKDSSEDVNGLDATVSNAMPGYQNTVLVGERARIDIEVTKDGAPYGGDMVSVDLKGVSGYTNYYELSTEDIQLNENGAGYVYLKLKSGYDYESMMSDFSEAAYASFELEFTSGGANFKKTIPVSFAQVWAETLESDNSIVVANNYDYALKSIETNNSNYDIGYSENKDGYGEEYVIEQQVSSGSDAAGNHEVVFDAAPLLVRSAVLGESNEDMYVKDNINFTATEYSVYENETNENNICTLENVPGGLEYLTLTFDSLKLSQYSRIIVRAYEAGTNFPLYDESNNLIQKVITPDTEIVEDSTKTSVQVEKEIFNETTENHKNIDLKIFIESAGQVNENENIGFTLKKAMGPWKNQEILYYDLDRMSDNVEWSFGGVNDYTGEETMTAEDAAAYLGDLYVSNLTYKVSMPAFPDTGNAIITGYDANGEAIDYYLYPTRSISSKNAVSKDDVTNKNLLGDPNPSKAFEATIQQVEELKSSQYTVEYDALGRCVVDSKVAGFVQLKADINVFDEVSYSVYSSVHWAPLPSHEKYEIEDFYALTGQTVTLTATLTDENGNLAPTGYEIEWNGIDEDAIIVNTEDYTTSNNKGQVTLTLKSSKAIDVLDIHVEEDKTYDIALAVAGNAVKDGHANIFWVNPGLYYAEEVAGKEYVTAGEIATVQADKGVSKYKAGHKWIIGTKVVGESETVAREILNISNIKIDMTSITNSKDTVVEKKDVENGICTVYSEDIGESVTNAEMTGILNAKKDCIITVAYDGETKDYVNVGVGDIEFGSALSIPITWVPNGQKLSWINSCPKYDINNTKNLIVYVKVSDIFGNAVENTDVTYKVTDKDSNEIVSDTTKTTDSNGLIPITIKNPTKITRYTVTANITGNAERVNTIIDYVDNTGTNAQVFTWKDDETEVDVDNQKISLIFSDAVNKDLITKVTKFFSVTSGGNTIDISSVEVDSSNKAKVVITTKQTFTESDYEVSITPSCVENNITYYLTSANGVLYTR